MKKIILLLCLSTIFCCKKNTDKIIFSSSRNGNSDIFIMDENGENKRALTNTNLEEWGPTWVDENHISFLRQKEDSIFRIKLDLKHFEEQKINHPLNCILDDKNILYSSSNKLQLYSCLNKIFIYNPIKKDIINITKGLNGVSAYPSWSNDGKYVIYTSNHLGSNDIFSYSLKSKKTKQLTNSKFNNERGELSPDGNFLVYSSDSFEKGNQDILIKNLKTEEVKNISKSPGMELIARFSSRGDKIFFGSNKDGNWEIYSYNLKSKKTIPITTNNEFDGDPRILKR